MGQEIWEVLASHQGKWVAVNREGKAVDADADLGALRERSPRARTYVFACHDGVHQQGSELAPGRTSAG